ncbi:hypothetical protein PSFL_45420 [Pseudomonas sp. DD1]
MCTYPLLRLRRLLVPPLRRVTFEERESNQSALAPPLGASPRLGMPAVRHCSVGPPRSAIPGRVAATPASMPGCPLRNTCLRPSWFNGAPKIKIKSQIKSRATATAMPKPGREAAFPPVGAGLSDRRIAAMTAERTHQSVRYSFVIVNDHRRQASSHRGTRTPRRSGRLSGRLALLVILILGAPLNHAGRHPILIWGVTRQDAGLAALGHGWPIAAAPQINVG